MKTSRFNVVALIAVSLFALSAQADSSLSSETDFPNPPNGCRNYDMVVSPDCDYSAALDRCSAAKQALDVVAKQMSTLNLDVSCDRLHTGSFWERIGDELMMGSSSYDGYKLDVAASPNENAPTTNVVVTAQAQNAQACEDAAAALSNLAHQGLQASVSCDGSDLRVQR